MRGLARWLGRRLCAVGWHGWVYAGLDPLLPGHMLKCRALFGPIVQKLALIGPDPA